jgi:hypothetical protein
MIVIFTDALLDLLALKVPTLDELYLRLYKNDLVPDRYSGVDDFVEADFTGYAAVGFVSWGTPFLNADDDAEVDHDPIVFTQTGTATTNNIYGYFVTDGAGTTLWFSERNPAAPAAMDTTGKTYTVIPKFIEAII